MTTNEFSRLRTFALHLVTLHSTSSGLLCDIFPVLHWHKMHKCVKNACAQNWFLIFSVWSLIVAGR